MVRTINTKIYFAFMFLLSTWLLHSINGLSLEILFTYARYIYVLFICKVMTILLVFELITSNFVHLITPNGAMQNPGIVASGYACATCQTPNSPLTLSTHFRNRIIRHQRPNGSSREINSSPDLLFSVLFACPPSLQERRR